MSHADKIKATADGCEIQGDCVATYLRERINLMSPNARAMIGSNFIEEIEEACVMLERQGEEINTIKERSEEIRDLAGMYTDLIGTDRECPWVRSMGVIHRRAEQAMKGE